MIFQQAASPYHAAACGFTTLSRPCCPSAPFCQTHSLPVHLLQQYYTQIEQIDELKRSITFPKLESPPADFLHQMEAYVKEAPRPMDEAMMSGGAHAGKKVRLLQKLQCVMWEV